MTLFNDQERRYFKKLFDLYDTDKSGAIGLSELKNLCKHLAVELTEDALIESVKRIGANVTDKEIDLDFDTFLKWLSSSGSESGGDEFGALKAKITAQGSKALTNEQIVRLKEVFEHFDADGSGSIDADELVNVFASMGQAVTVDDMREMIKQVDEDDSGEIEFPEFMMLMCSNFGSKTFETDMQDAFATVDGNQTGKVSIQALEQMIRVTTGGLLSDKEIQEIVVTAAGESKTGDGYVEYMKWDSLWEACREES